MIYCWQAHFEFHLTPYGKKYQIRFAWEWSVSIPALMSAQCTQNTSWRKKKFKSLENVQSVENCCWFISIRHSSVILHDCLGQPSAPFYYILLKIFSLPCVHGSGGLSCKIWSEGISKGPQSWKLRALKCFWIRNFLMTIFLVLTFGFGTKTNYQNVEFWGPISIPQNQNPPLVHGKQTVHWFQSCVCVKLFLLFYLKSGNKKICFRSTTRHMRKIYFSRC